MISINRAQIAGNLGKDPELKYTPSGTAFLSLSVAVNCDYKKDNEWVKRTEWFDTIMWGKMAESAAQQLRKGDSVYVEGPLDKNKWEDRDGNKRERVQIKVTGFHKIERPPKQDRQPGEDGGW